MTIERIPTNTSEAIVAFYKLQPTSQAFTLEDLFSYIEAFGFGTSRETIKRSLRNLRQDGKINYSIHNRSKGTLMVRPLAAETMQTPEPPVQGSGPLRTSEEIRQYNDTFKD